MATLRLPRTHGCLVCGRDNPRGLQLELFVEDSTGVVSVDVTFSRQHVGFTDVIHGGAIATVADEVMVWAATWAGKRFCLCGELSVRYLKPAEPEVSYRFEATVASKRSRLITTTCRVITASGEEVATAMAKYLPVSLVEHAEVVKTFLPDEPTVQAAKMLSS